jgi:hypothetical protein
MLRGSTPLCPTMPVWCKAESRWPGEQWTPSTRKTNAWPRRRRCHRIDIRCTSRHLVVKLDSRVIADTIRRVVLFESGFAPRWYVPREDIDETALTRAHGQTFCQRIGGEGLGFARHGLPELRGALLSLDDAFAVDAVDGVSVPHRPSSWK